MSSITSLLTLHTPVKCPSVHSKPGLNDNLSVLNQDLYEGLQLHRSPHSHQSLPEAKARHFTYCKTIKKATKDHWKEFLASVGTQDIWTAKYLSAGQQPDCFLWFPDSLTQTEINSPLLPHFFPKDHPTPTPNILSSFRNFSPLSPQEICMALF